MDPVGMKVWTGHQVPNSQGAGREYEEVREEKLYNFPPYFFFLLPYMKTNG